MEHALDLGDLRGFETRCLEPTGPLRESQELAVGQHQHPDALEFARPLRELRPELDLYLMSEISKLRALLRCTLGEVVPETEREEVLQARQSLPARQIG